MTKLKTKFASTGEYALLTSISVVNVNKNVLPLIGLVIGLIVGFIVYPFTELELVLRLWSGGLAGLSATGLFERAFNKLSGGTKE